MPGRLLAIFPLEVALLPHARLPLHIFEDRYKEMIGECLEHNSEFGVVPRRDQGILRTGCSASIEQVIERYADGRLDILTVGRRRFEIEDIDTERSFMRAEVRYLEDTDFAEPPKEVVERALEIYRKLNAGEAGPEPQPNAPELSFKLAAISDDQDFRQQLLAMTSEVERMEKVAEHLAWLAYREGTRETMKQVVRSNGHGRHITKIGEGP
jgi:Lon protease-like protein